MEGGVLQGAGVSSVGVWNTVTNGPCCRCLSEEVWYPNPSPTTPPHSTRMTTHEPPAGLHGWRVHLHLYDITQGMATKFSQGLLGKTIEAIWHTGSLLPIHTPFYSC